LRVDAKARRLQRAKTGTLDRAMPVLAIEVHLNGDKVTVAGAEELSVLTAAVAAVRMQAGATPEIHLHVGGITSREHLDWITQQWLKPGDSVTLRVLEVEEADPPVKSLRVPTSEQLSAVAAADKRSKRGLTARSRATRRKRRAPKRGRYAAETGES
jgi:hypothetical protein